MPRHCLRLVLYGGLTLAALLIANAFRIDGNWSSAGLILFAWLALAAAVYVGHHPKYKHTAAVSRKESIITLAIALAVPLLYFFWQYLFAAALLLSMFAFLLGLSGMAGSLLGVGGLLGILIGINLGDED